jgi:hypothetical protein
MKITKKLQKIEKTGDSHSSKILAERTTLD